MESSRSEGERVVALEAMRGLAAIVVIFHHFFFAFGPAVTGIDFNYRTPKSLAGSGLFFTVNGTAAVYFFFVLSGFVLSLKFFRTGDLQVLGEGVVKRFPRLWGPAAVSIALSCLLLQLGLDNHAAAAKLSFSDWLAKFAYANWPFDFVPTWGGALADSFVVFFTAGSKFNTNLWTMQAELYGSLIVFGLAAVLAGLKRPVWQVVVALGAAVLALHIWPLLMPFVLGVLLSAIWTRTGFRIPLLLAAVMAVGGLYLLGYLVPERDYAWLAFLPGADSDGMRVTLNALGAVLIIAALQGSAGLARPLSGRVGRLLGQLSFPLYLVHTIVILTVGSYAYVQLGGPKWGSPGLFAVLAVVLGGTLALAVPLMLFDQAWTRGLNRLAKRFVRAA